MTTLKDRLILITGASSGIGYGASKEFSEEGMRLALIGRDNEKLEKIVNDINRVGKSTAKAFVYDLYHIEGIPRLIHNIEKSFNKTVSILINNAAVSSMGLLEDIPILEYERNFRINVLAPLALIQSIVPQMKKNREGQIINILSGTAYRGLPGGSAYCSTKAALLNLTDTLRVELKPFGIDVLSFSPGPVNTPIHTRQNVFGNFKLNFSATKSQNPKVVAQKMVKHSKNNKSYGGPIGGNLVKYLNLFCPKIVDYLLFFQFQKNRPTIDDCKRQEPSIFSSRSQRS